MESLLHLFNLKVKECIQSGVCTARICCLLFINPGMSMRFIDQACLTGANLFFCYMNELNYEEQCIRNAFTCVTVL